MRLDANQSGRLRCHPLNDGEASVLRSQTDFAREPVQLRRLRTQFHGARVLRADVVVSVVGGQVQGKRLARPGDGWSQQAQQRWGGIRRHVHRNLAAAELSIVEAATAIHRRDDAALAGDVVDLAAGSALAGVADHEAQLVARRQGPAFDHDARERRPMRLVELVDFKPYLRLCA